jgi:ribosome maturation protein SDO1
MALVQPVGQKVLTNISVIKLKRKGKRFEIAVFPNKVSSWRNGLEKDIDKVVQSHSIFVNVEQGMLAKQSEVLETLEVDDMEKALLVILEKGKMKIAEKERKIIISNLTKDIASIVASQCVNINTERPLTSSTVERAMKEIGYSVKLGKAAKAQALTVIRELKKKNYPIARAKIRLVFYIKPEHAEEMIKILPYIEKVDTSNPEETAVIAQVEPGSIRQVAQKLAGVFGADIRIDILELYVTPSNLKEEQERREAEIEVEEEDESENEENEEKSSKK